MVKLKFLYKKNKLLTPELDIMVCNTLIQLHFDCVCTVWYPNLIKKTIRKIQIMQNKCIRFCLRLGKISYLLRSLD